MRGLVIRVYDSKEEEHEDCSKSDMPRRRYHGGIRCLMNNCGENDNDMDMELGTQSKGSAGPRIGESALGRRERRMGRPDNEGEDEEQEAPTLVLIRAFLPGRSTTLSVSASTRAVDWLFVPRSLTKSVTSKSEPAAPSPRALHNTRNGFISLY
jgi:hypothetical protein